MILERTSRPHRHLALFVACAALFAVASAPQASAQSVLLGARGTADLNGVLGAGEWDAAPAQTFPVNVPGIGQVEGEVRAMNDDTMLYLLVRVPTAWAGSYLGFSLPIEFDNDNDGFPATEEGDDGLVVNAFWYPGFPNVDLGAFDNYRTAQPPCPSGLCGLSDSQNGGTNDVTAAASRSATHATIEIRHPLTSGDARDFALEPGDTVGWGMGGSMWISSTQNVPVNAGGQTSSDIQIVQDDEPEPVVIRADVDGSVVDLGPDGAADFVYDELGSVVVGYNALFGPSESRGVYEFDVRGFRACSPGYSVRLRLVLGGTNSDGGDPRLTLLAAPGDGVLTVDDFGAGTAVTTFSPYDSPTTPVTYIDVSSVIRQAVLAGESHVALSVRPNPVSAGVVGAFLFTSNEISDTFGFTPTVLESDCALDVTAPILSLPADVEIDAVSPNGAPYPYNASATDNADPSPDIECSPASESVFPIGDTVVECTATDLAGNTSRGTFTIHVDGAEEQLLDLMALLDSYPLSGKLGTSLGDKLVTVQRFLVAGKHGQAEENLASFIAQVDAQRGKALKADQADALSDAAGQIIDVIDA